MSKYTCPVTRLNRPTERHTITEGRVDGRHVWLTCSCGQTWWGYRQPAKVDSND